MSVLEGVEASIKSMTWLTDSDQGLCDLARKYAATLDNSDDAKVAFLGPHLLNALQALGGTPATRKALAETTDNGNSKLAQLRAIAG